MICWRVIRRLRNELVHGYLTIDTDKVMRDFIQKDLFSIKKILEQHYPNWKVEWGEQRQKAMPISELKFFKKEDGVLKKIEE